MTGTVFSFSPSEIKLTPKGTVIQTMFNSISKSTSYCITMVRLILRGGKIYLKFMGKYFVQMIVLAQTW